MKAWAVIFCAFGLLGKRALCVLALLKGELAKPKVLTEEFLSLRTK